VRLGPVGGAVPESIAVGVLLSARKVDIKGPSIKLELLHGGQSSSGRLAAIEIDISEALASAGLALGDNTSVCDALALAKCFVQFVVVHGPGKVADKEGGALVAGLVLGPLLLGPFVGVRIIKSLALLDREAVLFLILLSNCLLVILLFVRVARIGVAGVGSGLGLGLRLVVVGRVGRVRIIGILFFVGALVDV